MKIVLGQKVVGPLGLHQVSKKEKCKKGWVSLELKIGGKVARRFCVKAKSIPLTETNVGRWLSILAEQRGR